MIIHEDKDNLAIRVRDGLKLLDIVENTNREKITFVGSKFESESYLWKIEIYNPDKDYYWIVREDDNPSPISACWIDAKWFRKAWIDNTIKMLGEWWLPK